MGGVQRKNKINYQFKKTHQKTKMKQNNKKQVYVAPAVEANVVSVENGFAGSNPSFCDPSNSMIEDLTVVSTLMM